MSGTKYYQKFNLVWFEVIDRDADLVQDLLAYLNAMRIKPFASNKLEKSWVGGFFPEDAVIVDDFLKFIHVDEESV